MNELLKVGEKEKTLDYYVNKLCEVLESKVFITIVVMIVIFVTLGIISNWTFAFEIMSAN